jgi:hypothetical protein
MSFSCAEIETRINQTMNHLTKNLCTKVARMTREFNVSVQRLRRRMRDIQSASDVREMHERRLKSDQNLILKIYIRKLIQFDLHSRLNVIKSATTKLFMQNASESSSSFSFNHMWALRWMQRHLEFQKIKRKSQTSTQKCEEFNRDKTSFRSICHDSEELWN